VLSLGLLDAAKKQCEAVNEKSEDDAYIQEQIAKRIAAKKAKNFAEADAIRDALKAQGILLVDTAQGTTWKRA
jgi:cysteinyl-tRNA synthetase